MSVFSPRGQALLQSILSFILNHPFTHLHPFINTGIHLLFIKVYIIWAILKHIFYHPFVCIHFTLIDRIDLHQFVNLHSIIIFIKIDDSIHSLIDLRAFVHLFVTIKHLNKSLHLSNIKLKLLLYLSYFIHISIQPTVFFQMYLWWYLCIYLHSLFIHQLTFMPKSCEFCIRLLTINEEQKNSFIYILNIEVLGY